MASRSATPLGQEATPSAQAASIMFWATRPASKSTSPPPGLTTSATARPAPSTLPGP